MKTLKQNQIGDTIVEVLISLTVLATVIGTAYAISSQALTRTQQAHERVRATKLAEEQIERLKYISEYDIDKLRGFANELSDHPDGVFNGEYVCLGDDNLVTVGEAACKEDNIFTKNFSYNNSGLTGQYTATISWTSFRTSNAETVSISYRVPVLEEAE